MERITLGSSPTSEKCAQLGDDGYELKSLIECEAYKAQLRRSFKAVHDRLPFCNLMVRSCPHDFGNYLEVFAEYSVHDARAYQDALWFERALPEEWDEEARSALNLQV